jgi:hypothetical protein
MKLNHLVNLTELNISNTSKITDINNLVNLKRLFAHCKTSLDLDGYYKIKDNLEVCKFGDYE